MSGACLPDTALARLMPMHVLLSAQGRVTGHGPTLTKLSQGKPLTGMDFFTAFDLRRPGGMVDMAGLIARAGERLHVTLRDLPDTVLRGLVVPQDAGQGALINLSFGIGIVDAVKIHALNDADFAPTDLAIEMLYLVEAKSAVMNELRDLNIRLQGAKVMAEEQAMTDTLTGLRNRRAFDLGLSRQITQGMPFALMHVDLDFFKAVNDTLGHAAGDHVLTEVARILTDETRLGDTVARVGGDEFVVLLPMITDPARLLHVANRIIDRLSRPIPWQDQTCRIAASIGMTLSGSYTRADPLRMLHDADTALYAAKRAGRGRAVLHQP